MERFSPSDRHFMQLALALAARASERDTSPNPRVGAVIVRDGTVTGEGYHAKAGGPHAEVEALRRAGERARGATMYVTLEPCNHHGRTPPCAPAVLEAGVSRVVAAMPDPNGQVVGGGLSWLAERGVQAQVGCLEAEARALNPMFLTWARFGRPYVTLKFAMTLDGVLACHTGHSRWITGSPAREQVHRERDRHQAILVGVGTVLADDPMLTVRLESGERTPLRVVLDSQARTPLGAAVLTSGDVPPWIYTTTAASEERCRALEAAGAVVRRMDESRAEGGVGLVAALSDLARHSVVSVFVEGGAQVHASFLHAGTADRILAFVAPCVAGGRQAPRLCLAGGGAPAGRWVPGEIRAWGVDRCIEILRREDALG